MGNIGYGNPQHDDPPLQAADRNGIIEIPGRFTIDGDGQVAPQIGAPCQIRASRFTRHGTRFLEHIRGKHHGQAVLPGNCQDLSVRVAGPAEHLDDPAGHSPVPRRICGYLHDHHLAAAGRAGLLAGDGHTVSNPRVVRDDHPSGASGFKPAHQRRAPPLHGLEYPALAAAIPVAGFNTRHDAVAVDVLPQVPGRDEYVIATLIGYDETIAVLVAGKPSRNFISRHD